MLQDIALLKHLAWASIENEVRLRFKYELVDLFAGRSVKPTSATCKTVW